ncbi:UNVERIFIED_CONTAM: fusaric acid resistance family protein [Williamsia faeni]
MPISGTLSDHYLRRRRALAHSLTPGTWRDAATTLNRGQATVWVPVRVGIAIAVVFVVGGLIGRGDIAGFAALGALTSAFCRADPYPIRMPRLLVTSGTLVLFVVFGAVLGAAGVSMPVQVVAMAIAAGIAVLVLGACRIVGPGPVVMIFAATAAVGFATSVGDVVEVAVAAVVGSVIGVAASLAPWMFLAARGTDRDSHAPRVSVRADLRRVTEPDLVTTALRVAVACAVAAGVAAAAGLSHPMWAAMGAIATLQGLSFHLSVHRGVQRLIGNIAGALIAAGLLALPLGYWGAVVLIVLLQTAAELLVTINYGLCSLAVTPMALLLTALGAGLTPDVALDRVLDTAVGVVLGIVVGALTIARHDTAHHTVAGAQVVAAR